MVDYIKFNGISGQIPTREKPAHEKKSVLPVPEDMTISTHLSHVTNSLIATNNADAQHNRVMELKNQINSNQYQVDIDALAGKLLSTMIS